MKQTGIGKEPRVIDRWEDGIGWIAHPEEGLQRASHALSVEGDVWLIDPLYAASIDDRLADLGRVAGVVVLLERHERDAVKFARQYDVPIYVPAWIGGMKQSMNIPIKRVNEQLASTGFQTIPVINRWFWEEAALFDGETLIVGDALGTAEYYLADSERLGVHPFLRLTPPREIFKDIRPDRIFVGHGSGIMNEADVALTSALTGARRRIPTLMKTFLRMMRSN